MTSDMILSHSGQVNIIHSIVDQSLSFPVVPVLPRIAEKTR